MPPWTLTGARVGVSLGSQAFDVTRQMCPGGRFPAANHHGMSPPGAGKPLPPTCRHAAIRRAGCDGCADPMPGYPGAGLPAHLPPWQTSDMTSDRPPDLHMLNVVVRDMATSLDFYRRLGIPGPRARRQRRRPRPAEDAWRLQPGTGHGRVGAAVAPPAGASTRPVSGWS